MDQSRRDFLRKAGLASLIAGTGFPLLDAAVSLAGGQAAAGHAAAAVGVKQWGMVVDIEKCLRPGLADACAEACRKAHNVPVIPDPKREIKWIWTENFENVFPEQKHSRISGKMTGKPVVVLCNHCTSPACVKVCPTQATWKRKEDGIVMMDMHRCIGCRFCMAACPYGARSFNFHDPRKYLDVKNLATDFPTRTKGVVEKCTFCEERLRKGLQPACVEAAGKRGVEDALVFGNIGDPDSRISRVLSDNFTMVRRLELGTGPNVFYLLKT